MKEPYEFAVDGQELCQSGRFRDAERAFNKAIQAYEKAGDTFGVVFALGQQGACYEESGKTEKAITTYRKAIELETDIPATYHALIALLLKKGDLDEAFSIAAQWQLHGRKHLSGPAQEVFLSHGARLTREKRYEEAVDVLSRTAAALPVHDYPDLHWRAIGLLGHAHEKADDTDRAVQTFISAIRSGSNDRQTFTRYLMFLERWKEFDTALKIIKKALKLRPDAAWEADLRKRQQRIERKSGKVSRDTKPEIIPAFSVRQGKNTISLQHQIQHRPQLAKLAVKEDTAYVTTGGKTPKLTAWNLENAEMEWQVELTDAANEIAVTQSSVILCARKGRIGEGKTLLHFFDQAGIKVISQRLPDVPTEIDTNNEQVHVGCRNGMLYSFSARGKSLWTYRVPGSKGRQESEYMRPCPYYLRSSSNTVAFSSFDQVYVLSLKGKLLWHWNTPETKSVTRSKYATITMSSGPPLIRGLALSDDGQRVIVTTSDVAYELIGGKLKGSVSRKGKSLGAVDVDQTGQLWAISTDGYVLLLQDRKAAGRFAMPAGAILTVGTASQRVLAWLDRNLTIATFSGKTIARIEFAKRISRACLLDNGKVIVGAGHLITLDTAAPTAETTPQKAAKRVDAPSGDATRAGHLSTRQGIEQGIPVRWIEGSKLQKDQGKAAYRSHDGKPITIEQLALEHYSDRNCRGVWSENEYWWAIMALLFWDVVFARLPGVYTPQFGDFPSKMQDMPTDFFTPEFYPRRKKLIDRRISELTGSRFFGLRKPNIEAALTAAYRRHRGTPCRPIDWGRAPALNELITAPKNLADDQLMKIMRRLLENFAQNRSGLPDLFLVCERSPLFAEVKSERERVAENQVRWLRFLKDEMGISVEVCRVTNG